ncbi:MAG: histidine phosphatase family protein [Pseudomonadota bacterium]
MLTLIAFRHAKSSWAMPGMEDFDRPLAERGLRDAPQMAAWLVETGRGPDLIVSSPSQRTRETLDLLMGPLKAEDGGPKVRYEASLYLPGPADIHYCLRHIENDAKTVLLVSHNPGLHEAVLQFLAAEEEHAAGSLRSHYPTAACAIIEFPASSWKDLSWGTGRLAAYMHPKMLAGEPV